MNAIVLEMSRLRIEVEQLEASIGRIVERISESEQLWNERLERGGAPVLGPVEIRSWIARRERALEAAEKARVVEDKRSN